MPLSTVSEPWTPTGWLATAAAAGGGFQPPPATPRARAAAVARSAADVARAWATATLLTALAAAVLAAYGGNPPPAAVWAAAALPVAGGAASAVARAASLPAAPFALLAGAGLRATGWLNVLLGPNADPEAHRVVTAPRSASSALIFFIAGVELDPRLLAASHPWRLLAATAVDAVVTGVGAGLAFGLPPALSAALGAVAKAAGPSLAVPLAATLVQARRGGRARLPELLVSASALSEAASLALFAFLFGVGAAACRGARPPSIAAAVAAGCTSLGVALGAGFAAALFLFCVTRLLATPNRIAAASALTAAAVKGGLDAAGHVAAGDLAAVVAGVAVKALWARGVARGGGTAAPAALRPRRALAKGDVAAVQRALGAAWFALGAPLLFACAGAAIDVGSLDARTVARAAAVVAAAGAARVSATLLLTALGPGRLPLGEAAFVSAAFASRATLQIALSGVAAAAAAKGRPVGAPVPPAVAARVAAWQSILIVAALTWSLAPTVAARLLARRVRRDGDDEGGVDDPESKPAPDTRASLVAAIDAALRASVTGANGDDDDTDGDDDASDALRRARAALAAPAPPPPDRLLGADDFLRARRRVAPPAPRAAASTLGLAPAARRRPRSAAVEVAADARSRRATVD